MLRNFKVHPFNGEVSIETTDYRTIYLINTNRIKFMKIPVWYLRYHNIHLSNRTHLLHETKDSFLLLDYFKKSVWIPKDIVEIESEY